MYPIRDCGIRMLMSSTVFVNQSVSRRCRNSRAFAAAASSSKAQARKAFACAVDAFALFEGQSHVPGASSMYSRPARSRSQARTAAYGSRSTRWRTSSRCSGRARSRG
ncbi:hypothetical protein BE11_43130 [Sorangium cellulosum]|nr:hypothetical protein BE11_43130 [Sorangium cellulosum]